MPGARRARTRSSSAHGPGRRPGRPVAGRSVISHHLSWRIRTRRGSRDRDFRARWTATRTAPGFLPTSSATAATSRPATTRSITISACSAGSVATSRSAAAVASRSTACCSALGAHAASALARLGHRDDGSGRAGPALVDGAVPGDGEQPGPELRQRRRGSREVAHDLQPGLGRQVLGGVVAAHGQVAQQGRVEGPPEDGEAGLVAGPGPVERRVEVEPRRRGRGSPGRLPPTGRPPSGSDRWAASGRAVQRRSLSWCERPASGDDGPAGARREPRATRIGETVTRPGRGAWWNRTKPWRLVRAVPASVQSAEPDAWA